MHENPSSDDITIEAITGVLLKLAVGTLIGVHLNPDEATILALFIDALSDGDAADDADEVEELCPDPDCLYCSPT